jgi:glycosyltransferase involved in cell wall biosynthesis
MKTSTKQSANLRINILFIINGLGFSENTGIGGSDKRAVEIIRHASSIYPKSNFDILTTESGLNIFKQDEKLKTIYHVIKQPTWWPNGFKKHLLGRFLSYLYCTIRAILLISKLKKYDVAFATSDFFFDVIPATFSHKNTNEGQKIAKMFVQNKIHFTENGIDINFINSIPTKPKTYDACFVGGIRQSKGINDLIKIWHTVIQTSPKAKLAIVGGGNKQTIEQFKMKILKNKLVNNFFLVGAKNNFDTIAVMKQSRIFLFPSYEEGWGIALHEALYCGLSIICYNLPAFSIFKDYLHICQIGNWQAMASQTIKLINSNQNPQQNKSIKFAGKFTWENIAINDINFLSSLK